MGEQGNRGDQRWRPRWDWVAGRLAHRTRGRGGRSASRPVPGPPGPGLRAEPGPERPRTPGFVRGAHPCEKHSWARCPAPWGRLAAGPAAPGRWAAPASRARPVGTEPGRRGRGLRGTAPGELRTDGVGAAGGGRWVRGRFGAGRQRLRQMFRGQMFAGWGEPGKNQFAFLPPCSGGCLGRTASKVSRVWPPPRATGNRGRGLRASLVEGSILPLGAPQPQPQPSYPRAVKYQKDISGIGLTPLPHVSSSPPSCISAVSCLCRCQRTPLSTPPRLSQQ